MSKNPFGMFDGIYVVNMARHTDRWCHFMKLAVEYGFKHLVTRIPGIYHQVGSYGCARAMQSALQTARSKGLKNVLLLQDDVIFLYHKEYVWDILNRCGDKMLEADMFYIGINPQVNNRKICAAQIRPDTVYFVPYEIFYGAFAVVVNERCFSMLDGVPDSIEDFKMCQRADNIMLAHRDVTKLCCNPALASVAAFETCTGVGHEVEGAYTPKNNHIRIPDKYIELGIADLRNMRREFVRAKHPEASGNRRISVVMPAFGTAEFVEEALDSVYAQGPGEILVGVDRCPETLARLLSIRHKYDNLKIFWSEENRGPFIMRNSLAYLSKGDIITFFDTDDMMKPGMLDRIREELDLGYDLVRYRLTQFNQGNDPGKGKDSAWYAFGSTGMTRDAFRKAGGFRDWRCAGDREMVMRCSTFLKEKLVGDRLYWYRIHGNNLTVRKDTGMRSDVRAVYHEFMKQPVTELYVEPVTVKMFEVKGKYMVSANMGTFPEREAMLKVVVDSILPHVDILRVHLNGYDRVPEWLGSMDRVYAVTGEDRKSAARFRWADSRRPEYFFTVDDDIEYSGEFFEGHITFLKEHPGAVVSTHGKTLHDKAAYPYDRGNWKKVIMFSGSSDEAEIVDIAGAGVMAFDLGLMQFPIDMFPYSDVTDATIASICRSRNIPLYTRAHRKGELRDMHDKNTGFTLWGDRDNRKQRVMDVWNRRYV